MSRTEKGSKGPGFEYWKSRHPKMDRPGGKGNDNTKRMTNRYERRKAKQDRHTEE